MAHVVQNCGGESQWLIYAKAANLRIEDMTQISKINSAVLTVYATDANMCINVKGNVTGELTMANEKRLIDADLMALNESEAYMSAQTKIEDPILLGLNSVVHRKIQQLIAETPAV